MLQVTTRQIRMCAQRVIGVFRRHRVPPRKLSRRHGAAEVFLLNLHRHIAKGLDPGMLRRTSDSYNHTVMPDSVNALMSPAAW